MTPSIPWWQPEVGELEARLVREVLESQFLNEGDVTTRFELELARLTGCRHAVAVTSGTAALFLSLKALGIGPGDEVVVPDLTFIATANAVSMVGATPVLADINAGSLTLDPDAFRRAITPKTRAVIPVHVSGRAADVEGILSIAASAGIAVVEDAAEALTSLRGGRALGTFGVAGCLSFSPAKTVTMGQGGAILTSDDALRSALTGLKDQGRTSRGTGGDDIHPTVGFNFKLTNLQAAVGLGQLGRLDARKSRIRRTWQIYRERLVGLPGLRFPGFAGEEVPQWVDVVVERRDELCAHLEANGVGFRRFWHPLHRQAPYRRADIEFPVCSRVAPQALWLPSAFGLGDREIEHVCDLIRDSLGG